MASATVNNPTNAKPRAGMALPFTTAAHISAVTAPRARDSFNTGKDYPDETAAPLMTADAKPTPAKFAIVPGITNPMTKQEMDDLSNMDRAGQGQHIHQLKEAVVMDVDAKLIISTMDQMRRGKFREAHYPTMGDYIKSPHYRQLREAHIVAETLTKLARPGSKRLRESSATPIGVKFNPRLIRSFRQVDNKIVRHLKESGFNREIKRLQEDGFPSDFGGWGQPNAGVGQTSPNWDGGSSYALAGREPDFIPLISGPYNKQLYWYDYLDMHSKAFDAWTHNPVAKRIVKVITQFVLGKGVKATVMEASVPTRNVQADPKTGQNVPVMQDIRPQAQTILDRHWTKNSLHLRSKQILRDLLVFGEQFIRYFDAPWGLKIRALDPSTVWEIITDPDDVEQEFYLHQQYPTQYQWFVDLPVPTIKFIIRQVPALLYYHMKINCTSAEKRGRSELFAILGWLKRLKEFASDRVVRNKICNLFVIDVSVEGDAAAVAQAQAQLSTPPTPGSFFIHNKAAELNAISSEIGAAEMQGDWELLLTVIAMGAGISQEYLGMGSKGGKAQALVGTEPDIKTFEDYQELMESFFLQDAQRCFQRAKDRNEIPRNTTIIVEMTYPALAEENRSEKLKDLAFGESMSWWSHRRVASAAAKELQFTSYEYDEEQQEIAKEDANKLKLINTAYQQVTKGEDSLAAKSAGKGAGGSSGGGGISSGSSGKGASGMGMGKQGAGGGGSSGQFESSRESEATEDDEAMPATAPGSSSGSHVSGVAVTHNASRADGKRDPWEGGDPRDVAESIKREAANLRFNRRGIGRQSDRTLTPGKRRDQNSLDRGAKVTDARKALKSGNFNHESDDLTEAVLRAASSDGHVRWPRRPIEEGGPGSGPHEGQSHLSPKRAAIKAAEDRHQASSDKMTAIRKRYKAEDKQFIGQPDYEEAAAQSMKDFEELEKVRRRYGVKESGLPETAPNFDPLKSANYEKRFQKQRGSKREAMEPFKKQDGERVQNPRIENFPTEKQGHRVATGKRNTPRGYGANKKEWRN